MWDGATRTFDTATSSLPSELPFLFQPGERFGQFVIVKPLGKGGMGQVYEAEETDSGRRVAVKVLTRGIGEEEERERFLSEGRIAASLSHPNLVYVFGTSEVQGLPVIVMELAPGGTLKDQLVDGKPMAPPAAVDAILQVIDGLEAAAALGILHRDIKPSNCFVDHDGRMLVGDFGLSISTLGRAGGRLDLSVAGTPGFASPEQLRGGAIDIRSDIYSTGATLYYLLTGRAPFEDGDITRLMTRVGKETPPAPAAVRRELPPDLSGIVMRCLAAAPGERYQDYRSLAAALEPFRTSTLTPAGLARRSLAGLIDIYAASIPVLPLNLYLGADVVLRGDPQSVALTTIPALITVLAYYGVLEGRFGAAAGKALLGLRVVSRGGMRPGFARAALRAAVFVLPAHLLQQIVKVVALSEVALGPMQYSASPSGVGIRATVDQDMSAWTLVLIGISIACTAAVFSTARRRNGFAGLHDLASSTRVVLRHRSIQVRERTASAASDAGPLSASTVRIGPFLAPEDTRIRSAAGGHPSLIRGFDDRLHRSVWIDVLPLGTPAVPAGRRDLGRATRARWLAGRRTASEAWDAYEALDGQPLTAIVPQSWTRVRHWLADLAHEVAAGLSDGTLPPLTIDRVWIGADDRARLLDWPLESSTEAPAAAATFAGACAFLYDVAMRVLRRAQPLPIHARDLLRSLRDGTVESPAALLAASDAALRSPSDVRRSTRGLQLALCALLPALIPPIAYISLAAMQRMASAEPAVFELQICLDRLAKDDTSPATREAIGIYMAAHLREVIQDPETWRRPLLGGVPGRRALAQRTLEAHASPSPAEVEEATAVVTPLVERGRVQTTAIGQASRRVFFTSHRLGWMAAAILGLLGALLARGGITFFMFGTGLVRADGSNASRIRTLLRGAIAWSPVGAMLLLPSTSTMQLVPLGVLLAGAGWALWSPSRGLQDRLAGTWLVAK